MAHEGYFFRSRRGLPPELVEAQVRVEAIAKGYGLDFCEIVFEIDMGLLFHTKVQRQLLKNMNEGTEDLYTELIQQHAVAIEKL